MQVRYLPTYLPYLKINERTRVGPGVSEQFSYHGRVQGPGCVVEDSGLRLLHCQNTENSVPIHTIISLVRRKYDQTCGSGEGCVSGLRIRPIFWPDRENLNFEKQDLDPTCTYLESILTSKFFPINQISSDIFRLTFFT